MKATRAKMILAAAASLPPAKGRALLQAVAAKGEVEEEADGDVRDPEEYLAEAEGSMIAAMEMAALAALEELEDRRL